VALVLVIPHNVYFPHRSSAIHPPTRNSPQEILRKPSSHSSYHRTYCACKKLIFAISRRDSNLLYHILIQPLSFYSTGALRQSYTPLYRPWMTTASNRHESAASMTVTGIYPKSLWVQHMRTRTSEHGRMDQKIIGVC
jgi:hypothetical protein